MGAEKKKIKSTQKVPSEKARLWLQKKELRKITAE